MIERMDEGERLDRIDALANRRLLREGERRAATEVWDEAAEQIDRRESERIMAAIERGD